LTTRIGVVGIEGGWSTEQLADALASRTGFRCIVDIGRVSLDLAGGNVTAGGQDLQALDGLVVKKIGGRYSPDYLDRLEILRYLAARGLPIYSAPDRITRVLNRLTCTVTLAIHDIPIPPTVVTEDLGEAAAAVARFGEAVLKPLYSTKARGMQLVWPGPDLEQRLGDFRDQGHRVLYVQQKVELPGHDLGLAFLGGEYLGTYARIGSEDSWNTTIRAGGCYAANDPPPAVVELAHRAQEPFGLDFTCVDVGLCEPGPVIFEVSAFGGFRGLIEGAGIDIAGRYADHVLARVEHGR
jgi:ribosomal protein S6--L-glutamate ligase